jgi:prepilin-type N-terminal cleavage/methylation domain-containing protein
MKERSGFTLIELLIVVAIIGILASLATVNFLQAQIRAKVVRSKAEMVMLVTGLELYRTDDNRYPPQDPHLINGHGGNTSYLSRLVPLTTPIDYISRVPYDLLNRSGDPNDKSYPSAYDYAVEDKWASENWDILNPDYYIYAGFKYMLTGSGPDGLNIYECQHIGLVWHSPYDPTNGTISHGQVMCLGPGNKIYP